MIDLAFLFGFALGNTLEGFFLMLGITLCALIFQKPIRNMFRD